MINNSRSVAMLIACGSFLVVVVPTAARAAEPSAQHVSAKDEKVVCHRVKKPGVNTGARECMSAAQWRVSRETKLVCRWGKSPGSETRQRFCATAAEWHGFDARTHAVVGPSGWQGTSLSAPGNTNLGGTAASQSSFQR